MKLSEAFKRLRFTIVNQNKPNQTDADALNEISKIFQQQQSKTIQENLLFAKLYAFILCEFTHHYTDVSFANKELNKVLAEPMNVRIELLKMKLKQMELTNYFNRKNILDPFLKTKTSKELEEIHERYSNKLPALNVEEFIKCGNNWDDNSVIYNLESNINLSIQNFKANV